jgi:uncharacterized protein YggE
VLTRTLRIFALCLALLPAMDVASAQSSDVRSLLVSGRGEVTAQPDLAVVNLGVEARNPSMEAARQSVNETVNRILALCRDLGIDTKLVNATRLQVQPDYSWNETERKRVLEGYLVSRMIRVELRELDKLGPLMERAIDAGVNQVSDPMLDSSRRKELERQALARAVEDARLNAEALSGAAGSRLGPVRRLNASPDVPVAPMYRAAMADAPAPPPPAEASYQVGEMRFTAVVSVEYDLLPGRE